MTITAAFVSAFGRTKINLSSFNLKHSCHSFRHAKRLVSTKTTSSTSTTTSIGTNRLRRQSVSVNINMNTSINDESDKVAPAETDSSNNQDDCDSNSPIPGVDAEAKEEEEAEAEIERNNATEPVPVVTINEKKEAWKSFSVPDNCLRLSLTLPGGQAFRWRRTSTQLVHTLSPTRYAEQWVGAIGPYAYVLRQAVPSPKSPNVSDPVWYQCLNEDDESDNVLMDYFQANTDFSDMYKSFCEADDVFETIFPYYKGMRTLRQPPEECFFAFICSSNNHIKRISSMVMDLATTYGRKIITLELNEEEEKEKETEEDKDQLEKNLDHDHDNNSIENLTKPNKVIDVYRFPTVETLAKRANEKKLRQMGFGYRAKFISAAAIGLSTDASRISKSESKSDSSNKITVEQMLLNLRNESRDYVAKQLTKYSGVGRKVAGCIALMSLDKYGEIPVDTHVWKIAQRYRPELAQTKSLTMRVYEDVGNWFRERFGEEHAGIAHNFLFVGELPDFKKDVPKNLNPWARQTKAETMVKQDKGRKKNRSDKPKIPLVISKTMKLRDLAAASSLASESSSSQKESNGDGNDDDEIKKNRKHKNGKIRKKRSV